MVATDRKTIVETRCLPTRHLPGFCLVVLAVALSLVLANVQPALADNGHTVTADGVTYAYTIENGEATVTSIAKAEGNDAETYEAVIPESVEEDGEVCLVTAIGSNAAGTSFSVTVYGDTSVKNEELTRVVIPSKCLSIGDQAFVHCEVLASLEFARDDEGACNVQSIGERAFAFTAIGSLDLPDTVGSVGAYAFTECGELSSLRLPARQTVWDKYVFLGSPTVELQIPEGCVTLPSVNVRGTRLSIPSTVQGSVSAGGPNVTSVSLPARAQFDTLSLTFASLDSLVVPEGVTTLRLRGDCADITFPESLVKIDQIVNDALIDFVVPASVETIGDFGFSGCHNLHSLSFAEGSRIQDLEPYSFTRLVQLESVTLPEGLAVIETSAFAGCEALKAIEIPSSVYRLASFSGCTSLAEIRYAEGSRMTTIGGIAKDCPSLETVVLSSTASSVGRYSSGAYVVKNCPKLATLVAPNAGLEFQEGNFPECGDFTVVGWGAAGKLVSSTEAIGHKFRPIAELDDSGFNRAANTAVVATGAGSVKAVCAFGGSGNFPYVRTLAEGVDYTVERVERGNLAYLVVKGMGDACRGSVEVAALQDISLAEAGEIAAQTSWNGAAVRPAVKLTLGGRALVRGRDFTVEYRDNDRAGTATAVATGVGNYTGRKEVEFEVAERHEPAAVESDAASRVDAALAAAALPGMPETCDMVVVAWAHDHAAVAAASALAVAEGAQLLVVSNAGGLTSAQKVAVLGWGATRALVVGGAGACGSAAVGDLEGVELTCEEVGASATGASALSAAVAAFRSTSWGSTAVAVVANPSDPATCLAAAAYAGTVRGPVVFTQPDGTLSTEAASVLTGFSDVVIAGDFAAVDATLETSLPAGTTAFRAETPSALVAHGKEAGIYSPADATYTIAARDAAVNIPYAASAARTKAPLIVS